MTDERREWRGTWEEVSPEYEECWRSRKDYRGMTWEEIMPGYWYGHEMACEVRYGNRPWSEIESDLRTGYPAWAERHGYSKNARGLWERVKDGVREAWETVTARKRHSYEHRGDREVPTTEMGLEAKRV